MQRATIHHQTGGVQPDGIVGGADLVVGRGKQRVGGRRVRHHHIKEAGVDFGTVGHKRHLPVDHPDSDHGLTTAAYTFDDFLGDIGVARQAQAQAVVVPFGRNRLGDHIEPLHRHVPGGVGVVGGDVSLLRRGIAEVVSGLHEKLLHLDVGGQRSGTQVGDVIHVGIVVKHPLDQRLQEVAFQVAVPDRPLQ